MKYIKLIIFKIINNIRIIDDFLEIICDLIFSYIQHPVSNNLNMFVDWAMAMVYKSIGRISLKFLNNKFSII